jgi:hypothetical protein
MAKTIEKSTEGAITDSKKRYSAGVLKYRVLGRRLRISANEWLLAQRTRRP